MSGGRHASLHRCKLTHSRRQAMKQPSTAVVIHAGTPRRPAWSLIRRLLSSASSRCAPGSSGARSSSMRPTRRLPCVPMSASQRRASGSRTPASVRPNSPLVLPQPGVNGIRYAAGTNYLYYTSTAQKLFMRVLVDPETLDPGWAPEFVAGGMMADDLCIDEDAGVAYIMTHRQNTIDRVPREPAGGEVRQIVAGKPFDEQLIGPSSGAWRRSPGDYGRVACCTTDGGSIAPPPDGIVRTAKLLRVEFAAVDVAGHDTQRMMRG